MRKNGTVFVILVLLNLIPIWIVRHLPMQDGPIHLSIANVLLHYHDPATPVFSQYYELNMVLHPNWTIYPILCLLLLALPAAIAEKVLLSAYVVLLPLSFRYATRANRDDGDHAAYLILPFVFNYPLLMGFYNFAFSVVLYFLTVGYWLRAAGAFPPRRLLVLALLSTLLFLSHIFSFLAALATILVLTPMVAAAQAGAERRWPAIREIGAAGILAFLPGLVLTVQFLLRQGIEFTGPKALSWKLQSILAGGAIVALDRRTVITGITLAVLLAILLAWALVARFRERKWQAWDGFLILAAVALVFFAVLPDAVAGGSFLLHRLNLFFFLLLVVWLQRQPLPLLARRLSMIGAIAVMAGLVFVHSTKFVGLDRYYAEYLEAARVIQPDRTVLPIRVWDNTLAPSRPDPLGWRTNPTLHASGYLSADREVVSLDNFQANEAYFPISYRPELNPYTYLIRPHRLFVDYPERTGGRIDYILLWDPRIAGDGKESAADIDRRRELEERLAGRYELVLRSSGTGSMRLFKRVESPAGITPVSTDDSLATR